MKIKQKVLLFLTAIIIISMFSTYMSSTYIVSAVKVGDEIGNVLNTDIKVYINDYQIPSYAVNNKMCVVMEDLANYGFNVKYDNIARTLVAARNYGKTFNPIKNIEDNTEKNGSIAFPYLYTDITAYIDKIKIDCFAIKGRLVIYIDDLDDYGIFSWDAKSRELKLKLYETSSEKPDKLNITIKGKKIEWAKGAEPYKEGTQIMLPLKKIVNVLGGTYQEVEAQGQQRIVFTVNDKMLLVIIGSREYAVSNLIQAGDKFTYNEPKTHFLVNKVVAKNGDVFFPLIDFCSVYEFEFMITENSVDFK
jgi:hypothetical protein